MEIPPGQENRSEGRFQSIQSRVRPGARIGLIIGAISNVAMFGIGIWGVGKCPIEQNIPLFLIATGIIGLFSKSFTSGKQFIDDRTPVRTTYFESSLYTAELIFLILGGWWVYKSHPIYDEPHDPLYCNKTVYLTAYIYISIILGLIVAGILAFIFFLICACFLVGISGRNNAEEDVERGQENTPIRTG